MKSLIVLAAFLTSHAFAINVCKYEETSDLSHAIKGSSHQTRRSSDHSKFTATEKKLIHETIASESYHSAKKPTMSEALIIFGDYNEWSGDEPGSNAGTIVYHTLGGQKLVIVHYWPGDNEYGSIFEIKNGKTKRIADIRDSFIECL